MWCPSVSLSVWSNSWLAGRAAPDDVLDAVSAWAPRQSVAAYDAVSAGSTGLSWPQRGAAAVSLLQTVRAAAGPDGGPDRVRPVFPAPGDVRGLPAGSEFARDAIATGEALLVTAPGHAPVGLVPAVTDADDTGDATELCWTVYALTDVPPAPHHDLGEAEYALRTAVRDAAATLAGAPDAVGPHGQHPRDLIEDLVESYRLHRVPVHTPTRALRVLESAALVDAILTVGTPLIDAAAQSVSGLRAATGAVQPLAAVVRSARAAAVEAILASAWRD